MTSSISGLGWVKKIVLKEVGGQLTEDNFFSDL